MRSGIDYIGQYRSNARAKQILRRLGSSTDIVVDWYAYHRLNEIGYGLSPERDNKSVWSPKWIETALTKFGESTPASLSERIRRLEEAEQSASAARNKRSNVPAARVPDSSRDRGERTSSGVSSLQVRGADRSRTHSGGAWPTSVGSATRVRSSRRGTERSTRARSGRAVRTGGALDYRGREVLADQGTRGHRSDRLGQFDPEVYERAKAATLAASGGNGRRREVLSVDDVVDSHVHPGHFSGAPYFCRNVDALERVRRDITRIEAGQRALDPFVAGRRVQHGPSGPKGRLVWMAPLATTILATRFSKPAYWGLVGRAGYAYSRTNVEIGTYVSSLQSRFEFVYCLDFSAFDASLPAWMVDDVFNILATHLDMGPAEKELFDLLVNDFIHSRIVLPDSSIWQVHRGVPSGSAFTSLVDSVANFLIIQYIWMRLTGRGPRPDEMMVLGDDSIVGSRACVNISSIAAVASELGITVSVQKSKRARSKDMVSFLGHEWKNSRPHRSMVDIAVRMAFPERWKYRSKSDSTQRCYSFIADAEEGLDLFLSMFEPYSRDVYQRIRDALFQNQVPTVIDARDGPGRLRFLVDVENDASVRQLLSGQRLAEVGIWY